MGFFKSFFSQTRKPEGVLGAFMLRTMNPGHAKLADWGMGFLPEFSPARVADLGCGGGRNLAALLERYPTAMADGVDYSSLSVQKTAERNKAAVQVGRCRVYQGNVSALPLSSETCDLATAFETVYFWPGLEKCFAEVHRILKPDGVFLIVNESDGEDETGKKFEGIIDGMKIYTGGELKAALRAAGFASVKVLRHERKPWIAVLASKAERPEWEQKPMKADYKNWVPKGMLTGFAVGSGALALGAAGLGVFSKSKGTRALAALAGVGAAGCGAFAAWCVFARGQFSYDGKRQLSKQIVEGTAEYVTLPDGGVGLDVGCGSGALTIACAKRNPRARMVGCDAWGPEYASFSRELCEQNAAAEGAENTEFRVGNAKKLPFADESFDAVTSNYVYHNVMGADRQKLLLETLRVLKKGGTFAIHDIMSPARYGDMQMFCDKLRTMGYERAELIDTANGRFMSRAEARTLFLTGSTLLVGKK